MKLESLRNELNTINLELARLLHREPVSLSFQSSGAEEDPLFLYGIVGGKDVGKTSLINCLAGSEISLDTDILDEGTRIAVGYSHISDIPSLKKRLSADVGARLRYVSHERDSLASVVLIDFPDFDSRFQTHREDMRKLVKHLQAVVWVISPRKYGDHELLDQLEAVAQSNENYYVVFNKIDQLEGKADLNTVRKEVVSYISDGCRKRNIPAPDWERLYLISAIDPERYDFPRLHEQMIRAHSEEEIAKAKAENVRFEFTRNVERLHTSYRMMEKSDDIDDCLSFTQGRVAEEFSEPYFETVRDRVVQLEGPRRRISRKVFARRVEHWPILRALFYPLGGVISFFGGRLAFSEKGSNIEETPRSLLRYKGESAAARMQKIRDEIETKYPQFAEQLGGPPDFPAVLDREFSELIDTYEESVARELNENISKPSTFRKLLVYFPLIWFPFLQPILYYFASREGNWFSWGAVQELPAQIIDLFGAGSLLQSAVFLLVFYGIWMVLLYANGARRVLTVGEQEFHETWYGRFLPWATQLLSQPLVDFRDRLSAQIKQLEQIRARINAE